MPAPMSIDTAAAAVACRAMGYRGLAEAIVDGQSVAARGGRHASTPWRRQGWHGRRHRPARCDTSARWPARHDGWDGETERRLALEALQANDVAFERAAKRAAEIVARHWSEITTES